MALDLTTIDKFRVKPGAKVRLREHATDWLPEPVRALPKSDMKAAARALLTDNLAELTELQDKFYADNKRSLLLVFQAMDAAGKDGTIRHVMSGVNPQGCQVYSFKVPSVEELNHDFLWRYHKSLPERGRIGIFNRSHYEEVLVVRVHPELLERQGIPGAKPTRAFWDRRYTQINNWERHLTEQGMVIVKFFLNVSKEEQARRFLGRIDDSSKNWKFNDGDLTERAFWDDYQRAYQDAIAATSTPWAPWYVVPADRKFAMRSLVSDVVVKTLAGIKPAYPKSTPEQKASLAQARATLLAQNPRLLRRNQLVPVNP